MDLITPGSKAASKNSYVLLDTSLRETLQLISPQERLIDLGILFTQERRLEAVSTLSEEPIEKILRTYLKTMGEELRQARFSYSTFKNIKDLIAWCFNLENLALHGYYLDENIIQRILDLRSLKSLNLHGSFVDPKAATFLEEQTKVSIKDLHFAPSLPPQEGSCIPPTYIFSELDTQRSDNRIINYNIHERLVKQLTLANEHLKSEPPLSFYYQKAPLDFIFFDQESESFGIFPSALCSSQGRKRTMDNQYIRTSFLLQIQDTTYPVQLFGIFEGMFGSAASLYVKEHVEDTLKELLTKLNQPELSNRGIWNALKLTFVKLHEEFSCGLKKGNTTALVALIIDGKLWVANLGNSRAVLSNNGKTLQLSEEAKLDNPRYRRSIEKRNGTVLERMGLRMNGLIPTGRFLGNLSVGNGICPRPKITAIPLDCIKSGGICILGSKNFFNVTSSLQASEAVFRNPNEPLLTLGKNLVYSALQSGLLGNISVILIQFSEESSFVVV